MTVQNKDNAKSCCSRPTDKIKNLDRVQQQMKASKQQEKHDSHVVFLV
jgi:hypothetical protein